VKVLNPLVAALFSGSEVLASTYHPTTASARWPLFVAAERLARTNRSGRSFLDAARLAALRSPRGCGR